MDLSAAANNNKCPAFAPVLVNISCFCSGVKLSLIAPMVSISPFSRTRIYANPFAPASAASRKISPPGLMRTLEIASLPLGMGRILTIPPLEIASRKTLKPESKVNLSHRDSYTSMLNYYQRSLYCSAFNVHL